MQDDQNVLKQEYTKLHRSYIDCLQSQELRVLLAKSKDDYSIKGYVRNSIDTEVLEKDL